VWSTDLERHSRVVARRNETPPSSQDFFSEKKFSSFTSYSSSFSSSFCPGLSLPETAQPLGQHGCASQIISNGAATITGKHHHVLSSVRRCRRTPRVQGRPAGGTETAGAQVLVTGHRLTTTWSTMRSD